MIDDAIAVATEAHKGQFRNDKKTPYVTHPLAVSQLIKERYKEFGFLNEADLEDAMIVAILHDVIEDTSLEANDLLMMGFSDEVVEGVESVTEQGVDSYLDKVLRAYDNDLGRVVKYFDIEHNLSTLEGKQKHKRHKYELAQHILKN